MESTMAPTGLSFVERLTRPKGRPIRNRMASARVTDDELKTLEAAAQVEGKLLAEWAREVLLRAARSNKDDALFTEVIAIRMLLNNLLGPIAGGQTVTEKNYVEIMANVRLGKRNAAREVMQQYTEAEQKEQ